MSNYVSYCNVIDDIRNFRRAERKVYDDDGKLLMDKFRVFDTPGRKYFKVFFYFQNQDQDIPGNDTGLLAPTWEVEDINDFNYYQYNSAWSYLKMNNEDERAEQLKSFVELLSDISSKSPWYFQEVSGLDTALERKVMDRDFKFDEARQKISIKCLKDAVDDRIGTLLDLYRTVTWSWMMKREVLPANLRKFDMGIMIFNEPYIFRGITPKSMKKDDLGQVIEENEFSAPWRSDWNNENGNPRDDDEWFKNGNPINLALKSSREDLMSIVDNPDSNVLTDGQIILQALNVAKNHTFADSIFIKEIAKKIMGWIKKDEEEPTEFHDKWNSYDLIDSTNYKYIEFHNCEFDYNSAKSAYSTISNAEGLEPEYTIDILFDDCYEDRYDMNLCRKIGDIVMWDIANNIDEYDYSEDVTGSFTKNNVSEDAEYWAIRSYPKWDKPETNKWDKMKEAAKEAAKEAGKNALKQLASTGADWVISQVAGLALGNINGFSLTRAVDQVGQALQGNVLSTIDSVKGYIKKDDPDRNLKMGNEFNVLEPKGDIYPDATKNNNPSTLGDIYPDAIKNVNPESIGDIYPDADIPSKPTSLGNIATRRFYINKKDATVTLKNNL